MNQTNPPLAPDYLALNEDWVNVDGPIEIAPGTTWSPQNLGLPPVYGSGKCRVLSWLQFQVDSPFSLTALIGVSNPSEQDLPMRPFRGVCYPNAVVKKFPLGGMSDWIHLKRLDAIDPTILATGITGGWKMNAASATPQVRADWPSLSVNITNIDKALGLTVYNLQFAALVL